MRAAPYDTGDSPAVLAQRVGELQPLAVGILADQIPEPEREKNAPSLEWSIDEYINGRVIEQRDKFYRPVVDRHRRAVRMARGIALVLGSLAVVLSVFAGGSDAQGSGTWVVALLGTVTTTAAAIAAWFQSGNHLQNALTYQATAGKLDLLLAQRKVLIGDRRFVLEAEAIFQSEHAAWLTQWQASAPRESDRASKDSPAAGAGKT
jgi:hypothetical protein